MALAPTEATINGAPDIGLGRDFTRRLLMVAELQTELSSTPLGVGVGSGMFDDEHGLMTTEILQKNLEIC